MHEDDNTHIPIIKDTISNQIHNHPTHSYILCGNFNRDIALVSKQNGQSITPDQLGLPMDNIYRKFIITIRPNIRLARQGEHNYIQNLIEEYFIQTPNNNLYT